MGNYWGNEFATDKTGCRVASFEEEVTKEENHSKKSE
jgi:hypothetical protein